MEINEKVEAVIRRHGLDDYRWINPREIVVSRWVRMKRMYGCGEYGRTAACPPFVPSVEECERFFREYRIGVVFHFRKSMERPEDRFAWTRKVNLKLLELEKEVFCSGFQKAFLLFLDSCNICEECSGARETCKEPRKARPTPEAMSVDVFSTVRKWGYPLEVLSAYTEAMNRYAFLLVE